MMTRSIILVAASALALVASPASARDVESVLKKPIKATVMSTMSVGELTNCLVVRNNINDSFVIDGENGAKHVAGRHSGFVSFVLTVTPVEGGTRIDRHGQPLGDMLVRRCVPKA